MKSKVIFCAGARQPMESLCVAKRYQTGERGSLQLRTYHTTVLVAELIARV